AAVRLYCSYLSRLPASLHRRSCLMRLRLLLGLVSLTLSASSVLAADKDAAGTAFFEKKIRPVLVEKCYACHSADAQKSKKLKGGLLLDTKAALLKGGDSGTALVPGK